MSNLSPAAVIYDSSGTEKATAANPLRTDPTGTTAQPVTDNGGSLTVDGAVNADIRVSSTAVSNANPVPVSDAGGSLTVDGTVTANQGGTWDVNNVTGTVSLPTGAATSANQTTIGSQTTKLNDGTNTAVIKAASTAALTADPSLVVALSPNSPLPTGSNSIGTVTAVQATAANLNALAAQGTAAALTGRWPVQVTDGTNVMPPGDVAARAGYIRVTDGTNVMPVGDVATRAAFAQISDGTNGPVAVKAASTVALTTDPSLVVQVSPNQQPIPTTVVPATSIAGSAVGRVAGISANTFTAVRQTTYVEQTANAQRSIVSTSANDTAAGTGARQVRITYLTATGTGPFTETITLNGLTAVNTVATDICFIERMDVLSVGSNGSNVGTLNLYTGTGATGTIFAAIGLGALATGVGDNQTLYAHHYVPVGYEVAGYYVSCGVIASAGGGSSTSIIRYRNPTVATSPWMLASDIINAAQGNSASRVYYVSISVPGPLVVLGYATPGTNNSTLTISFDYADAPI